MENVEQFRTSIATQQSRDDLAALFLAAVEPLGYSAFDAFSVDSTGERDDHVILCSYDRNLIGEYIKSGFGEICPALEAAMSRNVPFDYVAFVKESPNSVSSLWQRAMLRMNRVSHAWLVPLSTAGRLKGVTVYMQGSRNANDAKFEATRHSVHLMAAYLMERVDSLPAAAPRRELVSDMKTGEVPSLSERELACLQHCASGKTNWEISRILGVSENTVRFHLKNVFRKLDVRSRSAAAVRASRLGLIAS